MTAPGAQVSSGLLTPRPGAAGVARIAAGAIALAAAAGVALFCVPMMVRTGSILGAIEFQLRFFTILTGLLVGATFALIALGRNVGPRLIAGVAIASGLVGAVYALLLHGTFAFAGFASLADVLLHRVTPVAVPLFWLAFSRKGALGWRDPFFFALYPLAYLAVALVRGALTGFYPYPFINVAVIGAHKAFANAGVIALCFLLAGWAMVLIDRALARRFG